MTVWFDLDGTLIDLYGVEGWLDYLKAEDTTPYAIAKPLIQFSLLARLLNKVQANGHKIGVISWTSKGGSAEYNMAVADVKVKYLKEHLPSVKFDEICIVDYGTPKESIGKGILFDDEEHNRKNWNGKAYEPSEIIKVLKSLA